MTGFCGFCANGSSICAVLLNGGSFEKKVREGKRGRKSEKEKEQEREKKERKEKREKGRE